MKNAHAGTYRAQNTSGNIRRIQEAGREASRQGTEAANGLRRAAEHLKRASGARS